MEVIKTELKGVLIVRPKVFHDSRGFFLETYHQHRYQDVGISPVFVQDNMSYSRYATLRGLHYQIEHPQAKLLQVMKGEIYDVVVDIRKGSPTFGKHVGVHLTDVSREQLFVPAGFAHGFCVVSDEAIVAYKCSDVFCPTGERGVLWSDPDLAIEWPVKKIVLSDKDRQYPSLCAIPESDLPLY